MSKIRSVFTVTFAIVCAMTEPVHAEESLAEGGRAESTPSEPAVKIRVFPVGDSYQAIVSDETGERLHVFDKHKDEPDFNIVEWDQAGWYRIELNGASFLEKSSRTQRDILIRNTRRDIGKIGSYAPVGIMSYGSGQKQDKEYLATGLSWRRLFLPSYFGAINSSGEWQPSEDLNAIRTSINLNPGYFIGCLGPVPVSMRRASSGKMEIMEGWEKHGPPADVPAYYAHLKQVLGDMDLKYIEIVNEPDAGWAGYSLEELAEYFKITANGIRTVRKDIAILGPCTYEINIPKLEKYFQVGIFGNFDGISVHSYSNGKPPEDEWISKIDELKEFLAKNGMTRMGIYLTEFGWPSESGALFAPVTELSQAQYIARAFALLASRQIECGNYFILDYGNDPATSSGSRSFSILRGDGSPKPSAAAIATSARWLNGMDRDAQLLRPDENTYILLGTNGGRHFGVAWTVAGSVSLPLAQVGRIETMTGRPIQIPENAPLPLTESPLYFEMGNDDFHRLKMLQGLSMTRGCEYDLKQGTWKSSGAIKTEGARISVPTDIRPGNYLLWNTATSPWEALTVRITPPVEITKQQTTWDRNDTMPRIDFTLKGTTDASVEIQPLIRYESAPDVFLEKMRLEPGVEKVISVPMIPDVSSRCKGELVIEKRGEILDSISSPFDETIVQARKGNRAESHPVDFSHWKPFGAAGRDLEIRENDCSAIFDTSYDDEGIYFRIKVVDSVHHQTQSDGAMWKEDSVQIAIDPDGTRDFTPNMVHWGYQGHRVFSWIVGLRDGETFAWRNISLAPGVKNKPFLDNTVKIGATRTDEETLYSMFIPWKSLGLNASPKERYLGFSLLVNDSDGLEKDRKGLQISEGILNGLRPEKFGKLWLRH